MLTFCFIWPSTSHLRLRELGLTWLYSSTLKLSLLLLLGINFTNAPHSELDIGILSIFNKHSGRKYLIQTNTSLWMFFKQLKSFYNTLLLLRHSVLYSFSFSKLESRNSLYLGCLKRGLFLYRNGVCDQCVDSGYRSNNTSV